MTLASLIIAIIAVAAAAASAWYSHSQVAEMRHQFEISGPLVEVSSSTGIPTGAGIDRLQAGVTATNKGRGQANIRNWGFTMDCPGKGQAGVIFGTMYGHALGPRVPYVLAGLNSETWFMDRDGLRQAIALQSGSNVRPFVDLGDGSRIHGPAVTLK